MPNFELDELKEGFTDLLSGVYRLLDELRLENAELRARLDERRSLTHDHAPISTVSDAVLYPRVPLREMTCTRIVDGAPCGVSYMGDPRSKFCGPCRRETIRIRQQIVHAKTRERWQAAKAKGA